MIYKTKKNLEIIYNLNNNLYSKLEKFGKLAISGSFRIFENKFITDVDFTFIMNKKKGLIQEIMNFIKKDKNVLFEDLKLCKVKEEYFKKNNINLGDIISEEAEEIYRRWNFNEIENGIKVDYDFNFIFLEDLLDHILSNEEGLVINFFYKINEKTYIPTSIAIRKLEYVKKNNENIFEKFEESYKNKEYIKAYKRIITLCKIYLELYNLKEIQVNTLLKIMNIYQKNIFEINLYSSIETQLELIGKIDNYKIDLKSLIGNLLKFIKDKKIKNKLQQLKTINGKYFLKIDELKEIIIKLNENINKELEPLCKIDYKTIISIRKYIEDNNLKQIQKSLKKSKKNSKSIKKLNSIKKSNSIKISKKKSRKKIKIISPRNNKK